MAKAKFSTLLIVCIQWILFLVLLVFAGYISNILFPKTYERLSYAVLSTIAAIISVGFIIKLEKKKLVDYGLVWQKQTFGRFVTGFMIGSFIMILMLFSLYFLSGTSFLSNTQNFTLTDAFWYLTIIPLALMEEIAFRSYCFIKLNKSFGLRYTQLFVAIAFALYHFVQGWPWQLSLLGPGIWAFVFGLGAYYGKGIAVPTGIHAALNIAQSLSGLTQANYKPLLQMSENSRGMIAQDTNGLVAQILILLTAILLTEIWRKKASNQNEERNTFNNLTPET